MYDYGLKELTKDSSVNKLKAANVHCGAPFPVFDNVPFDNTFSIATWRKLCGSLPVVFSMSASHLGKGRALLI